MNHHDVIVIGAGFSGICAAIDLKKAGIHNVQIYEKADDVGGCWRDNTYPGVECDVPSHLYSYSFEPNPNWSKWYATGKEIWEYIRHCARKYDVWESITFGRGIESAVWQGDQWLVTDSSGAQATSQCIISGMGGLHVPNIPTFPGMESFKGHVFHTSNWRHDIDLTGLRVALVGTGATAVQVVPSIADTVGELTVFQRSPVWVGEKKDPAYTAEQREEFASDPKLMKKHRWELWKSWESTSLDMATAGTYANTESERRARLHIQNAVTDPDLVAALTPDYNFTCKRPTLSNGYYQSFSKDHVHLVTGAVESFTETGLATAEESFEVDVVILATGFQALNINHGIDVKGLNGLTLEEAWDVHITSYKSVMVRDFPNLFLLMGPNGGGLTSALQMIEQQSKFAVRVIERMRERGIASINPRQEEIDKFTNHLLEAFKYTTHNKGCTSWWQDKSGRNAFVWPESSVTFRMLLNEIDLCDFDLTMAG
ncbi:MAG: NAD(P)/FAD-dependent oxidoreductase [Pseudomonadota bacterium]